MYHSTGQDFLDTAANIAKREGISQLCRRGGVPDTALSLCVDKVLRDGLGVSEAIAASKVASDQAQRNTKLFIAGAVVASLFGAMMILK